MADAETIHRARRNGRSSRQFRSPGGASVNVDRVVDLVVNTSERGHKGLRRCANALLEAMSMDPRWRVTAGPHQGGSGGQRHDPDQNRHITLRVRNRGYHLQLTADGYIRAITSDDGRDVVPPYLPPGAPIPVDDPDD